GPGPRAPRARVLFGGRPLAPDRRCHLARADREQLEDGGGARRRPAHAPRHARTAQAPGRPQARERLMPEAFRYDAWSALLADIVTPEGKVDYARLAERRDLLERVVA